MLFAIFSLCAMSLACDQSDEANKLVDEANAILPKTNEVLVKSNKQFNSLFGDNLTEIQDFDEYKEENKSKFEELIGSLEELKKLESQRQAAFEKASNLELDQANFKDYLSLNNLELKQRVELTNPTISFVKAYLDAKDTDERNEEMETYNKDQEEKRKAADAIEEKISKLRNEHADIFEK